MSDLGEFHHHEDAETKGSKAIHWIIGLVIVVAIAAYAFESGMLSPHPAQTATNYPRGL